MYDAQTLLIMKVKFTAGAATTCKRSSLHHSIVIFPTDGQLDTIFLTFQFCRGGVPLPLSVRPYFSFLYDLSKTKKKYRFC